VRGRQRLKGAQQQWPADKQNSQQHQCEGVICITAVCRTAKNNRCMTSVNQSSAELPPQIDLRARGQTVLAVGCLISDSNKQPTLEADALRDTYTAGQPAYSPPLPPK
jgi:hypothetical protein